VPAKAFCNPEGLLVYWGTAAKMVEAARSQLVRGQSHGGLHTRGHCWPSGPCSRPRPDIRTWCLQIGNHRQMPDRPPGPVSWCHATGWALAVPFATLIISTPSASAPKPPVGTTALFLKKRCRRQSGK